MTRLRDEGLRHEAVRARNDQLGALADHAGYAHVHAALEQRRDDLGRQILSGKLEDDDYRRYCGELKGIEFALALPSRLTIRQAETGGPE